MVHRTSPLLLGLFGGLTATTLGVCGCLYGAIDACDLPALPLASMWAKFVAFCIGCIGGAITWVESERSEPRKLRWIALLVYLFVRVVAVTLALASWSFFDECDNLGLEEGSTRLSGWVYNVFSAVDVAAMVAEGYGLTVILCIEEPLTDCSPKLWIRRPEGEKSPPPQQVGAPPPKHI